MCCDIMACSEMLLREDYWGKYHQEDNVTNAGRSNGKCPSKRDETEDGGEDIAEIP